MIEELLRAGYGVEDIAKRTGHGVRMIREVVSFLRESGALAEIYRRDDDARQLRA